MGVIKGGLESTRANRRRGGQELAAKETGRVQELDEDLVNELGVDPEEREAEQGAGQDQDGQEYQDPEDEFHEEEDDVLLGALFQYLPVACKGTLHPVEGLLGDRHEEAQCVMSDHPDL